MINKIIHSCLLIWNFYSRVQLEEKFHIYARPCINLYIGGSARETNDCVELSLKLLDNGGNTFAKSGSGQSKQRKHKRFSRAYCATATVGFIFRLSKRTGRSLLLLKRYLFAKYNWSRDKVAIE